MCDNVTKSITKKREKNKRYATFKSSSCLCVLLQYFSFAISRPLPGKHSGLQFLLPISFVESAGALFANIRRYTNLAVHEQQYQVHHTYEPLMTPHSTHAAVMTLHTALLSAV